MQKHYNIIWLILFTIFSSSILAAKTKSKNSTFIGLSGGYSYNPQTLSADVQTNFELENSAPSYSFELGYRGKKNFFYSLNYTRNHYDTRYYDNIYLSANYAFKKRKSRLYPYVGVLGGWSSMRWSKDPVDTYGERENESSNYLVGAQVGLEYLIDDSFYLFGSYIYNYTPQKTMLYNEAEITYEHIQNIMIGIRYSFSNDKTGK